MKYIIIVILLFITSDIFCQNKVGTVGRPFVPIESNGAIPVNIQDQHTETIDFYLCYPQGSSTLKVIVQDDLTGLTKGAIIAHGHEVTD